MNKQDLMECPDHAEAIEKAKTVRENIWNLTQKLVTGSFTSKVVTKIMEYYDREDVGFFVAPGATSDSKHHAKLNGLADHTLEVIINVENLLEKHVFSKEIIFNHKDWLIIAALIHDAGKAGYNGVSYYRPNLKKDGAYSAKPFERVPERTIMNHSFIAAQVLTTIVAEMNINRTPEEKIVIPQEIMQAIYYHSGMYDAAAREASGKESPEMLLLHFADLWSARTTD